MPKPDVHVMVNAAVSLDGCLNDCSGRRLILSSAEDLAVRDALRAASDAVLVGAGTLRADNPKLLVYSEELRQKRLKAGAPEFPARVTITASGKLDSKLAFFENSAAKIIYCASEAADGLHNAVGTRAAVVPCAKNAAFSDMLVDLEHRGINRLLVEGGQSVITQLFAANLVDELRVAVAPLMVGDVRAPRLAPSGPFPNCGRMTTLALDRLGDTAAIWCLVKPEAEGKSYWSLLSKN
jgi:riboflavin-specific deaminase-like protein